ncbi:MAG: hypothetical protein ACOCXP_03250 [Candidatus Dojkabacteria bacterium]
MAGGEKNTQQTTNPEFPTFRGSEHEKTDFKRGDVADGEESLSLEKPGNAIKLLEGYEALHPNNPSVVDAIKSVTHANIVVPIGQGEDDPRNYTFKRFEVPHVPGGSYESRWSTIAGDGVVDPTTFTTVLRNESPGFASLDELTAKAAFSSVQAELASLDGGDNNLIAAKPIPTKDGKVQVVVGWPSSNEGISKIDRESDPIAFTMVQFRTVDEYVAFASFMRNGDVSTPLKEAALQELLFPMYNREINSTANEAFTHRPRIRGYMYVDAFPEAPLSEEEVGGMQGSVQVS